MDLLGRGSVTARQADRKQFHVARALIVLADWDEEVSCSDISRLDVLPSWHSADDLPLRGEPSVQCKRPVEHEHRN